MTPETSKLHLDEATPPESPPVRERDGRTQRTRRSLGLAALELFESKGVENVTVADVAAAAGVTERTFFRHFRSKEEAALLIHQRFDAALLDGLAVAPKAPPHEILAGLYRGVLEAFEDRGSPQAMEMLRVQTLVAQSPQLRLASLRRDDDRAEELVAHLRSHAATTSGDDELDVRMAVEVTGAAVRTAFINWSASDDSVGLADLFDRCLRAVPTW